MFDMYIAALFIYHRWGTHRLYKDVDKVSLERWVARLPPCINSMARKMFEASCATCGPLTCKQLSNMTWQRHATRASKKPGETHYQTGEKTGDNTQDAWKEHSRRAHHRSVLSKSPSPNKASRSLIASAFFFL